MSDVIARWHDYAKSGEPALLEALIAEDAVFQSPAVHTAQHGKAITLKYLSAATRVLGPKLRYVGEWRGDDSAILEFESEVGGMAINGVDMIWWNDAGQITRFKVMVRPLKGLHALVEVMGRELAG